MKIVFRVDTSIQVGSGHLMRCLALAEALRGSGREVQFICRRHSGNMIELIRGKEFIVHELSVPETQESQPVPDADTESGYTRWLGTSQEQDASETIEAFQEKRPDWLIVDHYALDQTWEKTVMPYVKNIMVIDDLANRPHDCDLLLDQNWFEDKNSRYEGLVPTYCTQLLGPEYALLRPEFAKARKKLKPHYGDVKNIFVFFGGSDPHNLTGMTIRALSESVLAHLRVDAVIGENNPHRDELKELASTRPQTHLHIQADDMASIMAKADMAIGSGGVNTWERMCLGLYALTISFTDNHKVLLADLEKNKFIGHLGKSSDVDETTIRKEVLRSIRNSVPSNAKNKLITLLDGNGTEKVAASILKKTLRICLVTDKESWINDFSNSYVKTLKSRKHNVSWVHDIKEAVSGDICILLGCGQFMNKDIRHKNKNNVVVHASSLPQGKGWSPLTWQILEGKNSIQITLLEVEEKIDSGKIYYQKEIKFEGHELINEMRKILAEKSFELCDLFLNEYPESIKKTRKQDGKSSYYKKRNPEDSELDVSVPLSDNFNLLRTVDNERYPAFFYYKNHKYKIKIEKY